MNNRMWTSKGSSSLFVVAFCCYGMLCLCVSVVCVFACVLLLWVSFCAVRSRFCLLFVLVCVFECVCAVMIVVAFVVVVLHNNQKHNKRV